MKINGYAMSLLLGIAFTSTAGAQCPIKDSIMGVGRSFETYDAVRLISVGNVPMR